MRFCRHLQTCSYQQKTNCAAAWIERESKHEWVSFPGSPSSLYQNVVENGANTSSANSKTVRVKLPNLEVRNFSGKLEEWQEFWDSFESAIHSNDSLSNVDKFSYLRGLLLDPARSAITGFVLTSANYEAAVELLKKRFGKKTAIQRTLVNELLNTRPVFTLHMVFTHTYPWSGSYI